jgi:hypothetical protein
MKLMARSSRHECQWMGVGRALCCDSPTDGRASYCVEHLLIVYRAGTAMGPEEERKWAAISARRRRNEQIERARARGNDEDFTRELAGDDDMMFTDEGDE